MKNIKKAVVAIVGAATLMMPLGAGIAHAVSTDLANLPIQPDLPTAQLVCNNPSVEVSEPTTKGCDLAIDKQVSINGGAFVEADTSADAAQAQIGDTVTWKITVTNASDGGLVPQGILTVADVLPGGAAFDSYTATAGTYGSGIWTFDLSGNLPATLTIASHAISTGLFKNTATLSVLDSCSDDCVGVYSDSDPSNNSNDAWFDPSAKPVVLAASTTLTNTGSGTEVSAIAAALIAATLVVVGSGRFTRRGYKVN